MSKRVGQIQLIIGPMYAGKTSELLRRIRRYTIANRSCAVIKYRKDTRFSEDNMATHDKQMWAAVPAERLKEVADQVAYAEVIGIDEGQFFPDLVEFCEEMANQNKIVVVAALDGTFQRRPFGDVLQLIPLAESVTKLNAVCMVCFKDASFTKRLGSETQVELIGGSDMYISVCRACYHKDTSMIKPQQANNKKRRTNISNSATIAPSSTAS